MATVELGMTERADERDAEDRPPITNRSTSTIVTSTP